MSQRVVVTDHAFRDVEFEMAIAAKHGAEFECFSCDEQEETIAAIKDADVAFVNFAPMTEAVLSRFKPGATLIRYGIGYDNVDIEAAKKFGVAVANVPDYGVETVADHATSSLLAIMRRLPVYDSLIKANGWAKPAEVGSLRGFRSTTIGLVGFGRIAQAVHRRLAPFGFRFVAFDPFCGPEVFERLNVTSVSLQELSEQAHAVSLHAPSTPENHHLIGSEFLAGCSAEASSSTPPVVRWWTWRPWPRQWPMAALPAPHWMSPIPNHCRQTPRSEASLRWFSPPMQPSTTTTHWQTFSVWPAKKQDAP